MDEPTIDDVLAKLRDARADLAALYARDSDNVAALNTLVDLTNAMNRLEQGR